MELVLSPEDEAFRQEVRAFLAASLPADIAAKSASGFRLAKNDHVRWQKILHAKGWIAPNWPVELGGTGWTAMQKHIFDEECAAAGAPMVIPFGVSMVAPVIITFGNQAQKDRYLPRILSSDEWWCQGYSEPGAGSDLASLRTKAVRDGDHYVVTGQKTWTTLAQHADMMFTLVRTADTGKKQEGITFLLIDMTSPGISVQPITTIDGSREINSVFLDAVRVPVENRVGEEGQGWTYAKYLLGHERTGIAAVGRSKAQLRKLKEIARAEQSDGRPLLEDPEFAGRVARIEIDLLALESLVLRILHAEKEGKAPGPEASFLKIKGTEIQQGLTELLVEAIGPYAAPFQPEAFRQENWNEEPVGPDYGPPLAPLYFNWRKASIYGGSNEIQRSIIAKSMLGL